MVYFGLVVLGPPGSGKTTFCAALERAFASRGRNALFVNLDPSNDRVAYKAELSLNSLLESKPEAQEAIRTLGPNGGLMYSMQTLAQNPYFLDDFIKKQPRGTYFVFDCPGQVELYTHDNSLHDVFDRLNMKFDLRLCAAHLVDSVCCADSATFVSALVVSLNAMAKMSLPHVNILTKIDLLPAMGKMRFDIDYFMQCQDLEDLAAHIASTSRFGKKYEMLTRGLCQLVEDYSMVCYSPLTVTIPESIDNIIAITDKANGYSFSTLDPYSQSLMDLCYSATPTETGAQDKLLDEIRECVEGVDDSDDDEKK